MEDLETKYRLEFNKKTQKLRLDNYTHEPNTFGWVTVCEYCTDFELDMLLSYMESTGDKVKTLSYLVKCTEEITRFYYSLFEKNIYIEKKYYENKL